MSVPCCYVDCWSNMQRSADGKLVANSTNFPSGMKALSDYIHGKGAFSHLPLLFRPRYALSAAKVSRTIYVVSAAGPAHVMWSAAPGTVSPAC